jgi:hypothetical protein
LGKGSKFTFSLPRSIENFGQNRQWFDSERTL